jgi:hypothetical protein
MKEEAEKGEPRGCMTRRSQKVPGMVALLHCNGRTHGNAYLITFQVGPLRTCSIDPATVEAPAEGSVGILRSSALAFHSMPSSVAKRFPLRQGTARSAECGGWVMTQQAMSGSVCYRDAATTVSACHELVVHQTVDVEEFRELFDCPL